MKIGTFDNSRAIIPAGDHILTLESVNLKRVSDKFADNAEVDKLLWQFRTAPATSEQCVYQYAVWTKTNYGDDRAALTKLLDMLVPGCTRDQVARLDTDALIGRRYRTKIVHKSNTNGNTYASHLYLEPETEVNGEERSEHTDYPSQAGAVSRNEVSSKW